MDAYRNPKAHPMIKKSLLSALFLLLAACASQPPALTPLKKRVVGLAVSEWHYFGRQTVLLDETREIINPVGYWEDDEARADRVRQYWQTVGRPHLTGYDCQEPWSAAFMSWLMRTAGVAETVFPSADAHWVYLDAILDHANQADALFIPHRLDYYAPRTGDLICAYREPAETIKRLEALPRIPPDTRLHCDVVVKTDGRQIETIGGNVRNSVSRTIMPLDRNGRLHPLLKRYWFMAVEIRGR